MVLLISHPSFFLTSMFFHVHNILQLSMYHCMTYIQKKNNQTAVSIHTVRMHTFSICTLNTLQNITKTPAQNYREGQTGVKYMCSMP